MPCLLKPGECLRPASSPRRKPCSALHSLARLGETWRKEPSPRRRASRFLERKAPRPRFLESRLGPIPLRPCLAEARAQRRWKQQKNQRTAARPAGELPAWGPGPPACLRKGFWSRTFDDCDNILAGLALSRLRVTCLLPGLAPSRARSLAGLQVRAFPGRLRAVRRALSLLPPPSSSTQKNPENEALRSEFDTLEDSTLWCGREKEQRGLVLLNVESSGCFNCRRANFIHQPYSLPRDFRIALVSGVCAGQARAKANARSCPFCRST